MKLIDLLVQELPKRGGWPDGAIYICTEKDGTPRIVGPCWHDNKSLSSFKINDDKSIIYSDQYESVLAESQKPVWKGEGIPPAGCECEFISNGTSWGKVKVIGFDGEKIVIRPSGEIYYAITPSDKDVFIPFRTEEEKKRDIVVGAIKGLFKCSNDPRVDDATLIYNAIAAGKIPGVKLDD